MGCDKKLMSTSNRLIKEFSDLKKEKDVNFKLFPNEQNLHQWNGILNGPSGTPYQNEFFDIKCKIPVSYPISPPEIVFKSKIFHPNIHSTTGEICLDILKSHWTPAWSLSLACQALIVLLANPEPSSPLNCDAGNLLRNNDFRGFSSLSKIFTNI